MIKDITEIDHLLAKASRIIHFGINQGTPEREVLGILHDAISQLNDKVNAITIRINDLEQYFDQGRW